MSDQSQSPSNFTQALRRRIASGLLVLASACGAGGSPGDTSSAGTSGGGSSGSTAGGSGCQIQVAPNPLDFGNIPLNISVTDSMTLTNAGDAACAVSGVALDPGGSPLFSLPSTQALSFSVDPGASQAIKVTFDGSDPASPHQRTGTLNFTSALTGGTQATPPQAQTVALQANIATACTLASESIYTIDQKGILSTFDPLTLTYTDLGTLTCPDTTTPFSMAIDQTAIAWVEYGSGNLYRVDVTDPTLTCTATTYQVDSDIRTFGMSFAFQPSTGTDTLYVAGNASFPSSPSTLATVSFPALTLSQVAPLTFGGPELTGTGDGQLWGFAPAYSSASGVATLAQIDPATGNVLTTFALPSITAYGDFAVKFWGGSLWLFLGSAVYQVDRTTGMVTSPTIVNPNGADGLPRSIVGAGVSTCAPVQ